MGFDTTYRPHTFEDVAGQDATIEVLKTLLRQGKIFERSYVFAGPSGTGKTTIARILARAMLCEDLRDGTPCDACSSCRAFLEGGEVPSFKEMDAANNSGAANIRQIVESLGYFVLGGRDRTIYLIDEAHRLSAQAMDALLKPMEDTVPGSKDKRLVCLFCTTEPHKLRGTIKGRSMVFDVQSPTRQVAVERLAYICTQEGLSFDSLALETIFDYGQGHMRDMVTALERVSVAGEVTPTTVKAQLGLAVVDHQYQILKGMKHDSNAITRGLADALVYTNASSVYQGVAQAALAAYRLSHDITTGLSALDQVTLRQLSDQFEGEELLLIARHLLANPVQNEAQALCELLYVRHALTTGSLGHEGQTVVVHQTVSGEGSAVPVGIPATKRKADLVEPSEAVYQNQRWADQAMSYGSKSARGKPVLDVREDLLAKRQAAPSTLQRAQQQRKGNRNALKTLTEEEP